MAETGVTGGLSASALGGIAATVVVLGGAAILWLGVFDPTTEDDLAAEQGIPAGQPVTISPSAQPPAVIKGLSQQPDPAEPAESGQVATAQGTTTAAVTASEATTAPEAVAETAAALFDAPQLDLVRVDPTGDTVIAGRAVAGGQVAILLDGEVLQQVEVQAGGDFVAFAQIPPSHQARVISLRAESAGQQRLSDTSFILAPASPVPASAPAIPVPDTAPQLAESETASGGMTGSTTGDITETSIAANRSGETSDPNVRADADAGSVQGGAIQIAATSGLAQAPEGIASTAPQTASPSQAAALAPEPTSQTADTPPEPAQPEARDVAGQAAVAGTEPTMAVETRPAPQPQPAQVAVLRADAEGVTLVQPATQQPQDKVVLDTISYSDSGEVQLAGRARAATEVRVYLDNSAAGAFTAAQNGTWAGRLLAIRPGVYTLRLDEVSAEGVVLSRLETPFKREAPERLQAPASEAGISTETPLVRAVTVQEGDTLWAISQERYGSGFLYVRVFEANQAAIRDPDLIYPGQVFSIPD
ncbi:LysM peptidoglycan-binding domain-containing protein [Pseudophaeobacter flagellatus]|uniref:LysM peptidoglycan-binding domain-containing protein n=1 Tax=Pseudophaeobacter flagellatus TaxID=2899119 RepID=UPI001E64D774|nr:LysM peptidoglycan-binding domain-containing protein [Pseudophaeobacter flagellatus]MCD9147607.1 LysM peptidoglycan-binding domain-containing protein [Pseudophaeobacter flagellatus]